jgi:hypothetical protein
LQRFVRMAGRARRWSQRVTRESNALDLERGVFTFSDPRKIALSLKRSADRSRRRKSDAFASAMSMLSFYINRAGRGLPQAARRRLERAKVELRVIYGRSATRTRAPKTTARRSSTRGRRTPGRRRAG